MLRERSSVCIKDDDFATVTTICSLDFEIVLLVAYRFSFLCCAFFVMFFCFALFVFVLCLVYEMLPVSLDCPF